MAGKPGKSTDILDAVALLVVDMQTAFLDVIEGASTVIERCGFAIEAARSFGLRVVFTEQVPAKLGPTDPRLLALVPGARVFAKNSFSALQADGLHDYLRRQGIYHLLLVGVEVPVCIYQTALHASDSDFDVTVLSDCTTGRRLEDCLVTLEALTRAHCHVLPAETVFYSMLGHSGHPLFPAFNILVKRYTVPGGLDSAPPPPAPRERPPERRPVLAAPEDQPDAPALEEVATENGDTSDNEPYIGRSADGAPAAEPRDPGERENNGEEISGDSEDDETESGDDDSSRDEAAPAPAGQGGRGEPGGHGEPGRQRRGRRRRGGARRRRARERREGPPAGGGNASPGGDPGANSAGAATAAPERGDDIGSAGAERAPE